jgi:mycothiol synthase
MPTLTGLAHRPYTKDDAAAVTDLMNRAEQAYGGDPGLSVENLHAILTGIARDLERDSRLVFVDDSDTRYTGGGTLVAVGAVSAPSPGGRRTSTFGAVHPDWQRRGIGRELFGWQAARIVEMKAAQDPAAVWDLRAGADERDVGSMRLFESFGLRPVRYFLEMVADPATAPEVAVPDGLRAVTYTPDLVERLYEAHMEAFADHWGFEREPYEEFRANEINCADFRADLTMIALDGDEIAGYVISYDGADGRQWVGMVGTRRPWRRQGLAGALVARSLRAAAATDRTVSVLGVDTDSPTGAVSVYERVGFTMRSRSISFESPLPADS